MAPKDRRALNTFTKRYWASKTGASPNIVRSIKSKGGVVEDVLNVISEPDERKVRGQPNTYSGMAGVLFQDEEERGAFAEGGKVSITDTDEMYGYLTKDEDEYNVFIDKRPISIYTEETLPDLDIKETYYTGFKGNTVSDRLNSVRQSSTIGLPVTTDKKKARGVVRVAGKIKFGNVLKLNIDSATPEAVQAELNKNMDSLIKIEDKILGKEIIKAANDNLAIRDDVLNNDPDRTPEKEAVIAKSKSFLVRHQLLKLGYDAIETKEGYTLLRENQFLTTDIMERGFKGGGLATVLRKRQQYKKGGEALTFNQEYHLETIRQKKAMRNSEGKVVTVRSKGFEKDGTVYNLPTYDRRGGALSNPLKFFKKDIKAGRIQGYAADKETYSIDKGNMHLHPANIAASKEHEMMESEAPEDAITFGAIKRASIESTRPTIEEVAAENKRRDDLNIQYGLVPPRGPDVSNLALLQQAKDYKASQQGYTGTNMSVRESLERAYKKRNKKIDLSDPLERLE
jgi:hypothetical protein